MNNNSVPFIPAQPEMSRMKMKYVPASIGMAPVINERVTRQQESIRECWSLNQRIHANRGHSGDK